jgi:hypothetical protein
MADSKISELTELTIPMSTDIIPIVDIANTTTKKITFNNLIQTFNVKAYGAKGDGSTNDQVAINSAITAATSTGGEVFFPTGTYKVSSSGRTDASVSYSGGTWTDEYIVTADVGSYVLGLNINDAKIPKILTVNNGVSFTTDVAPAGTVTTQNVVIVKPSIIIPSGVNLVGTSYNGTKILDYGSGITVLVRGGDQSDRPFEFGLDKLSIHGNSNSTMYGVFIGNFAWYFTIKNCHISYHGVAGLAADGNINSNSVYDTVFKGNGVVGATTYSGGVLTHPYYLASSSSLNLYNCFFDANYGWGVCSPKATGATGIGLYNCQFNSTLATSATGSGTAIAITDHANNADAKAFIVGGWSEGATLYDVDAYGSPSISDFTMASAACTNHLRSTGGSTLLSNCRFQNASGVASVTFGAGGNISWANCTLNDNYFFGGCGFSNANVTQFGSSGGTKTFQGTYNSMDNSAGITTTITTATLVGKTITIKDGIITAFA